MPSPWFIIGALLGGIGLFLGGYWKGDHDATLSWKSQIAQQSADAEALRAQLTAANAEKDRKASEYARELDQIKADADKKNAADADVARGAYADELRRIAASGARCRSAAATEAVNSERLADSTRERQNRLLEGIAERVARLGGSCNELAGIVRDIAVPWAASVGR